MRMKQKFTIEDIKSRIDEDGGNKRKYSKLTSEEIDWLIECAEREAKYYQALWDINTCIRWEDKPIPSIINIIKESKDY